MNKRYFSESITKILLLHSNVINQIRKPIHQIVNGEFRDKEASTSENESAV